jgi:trehalose 6-phosphate phosphatase
VGPAADDLLAPLRARPEGTAIMVDFDGTLAPIVVAADRAVPLAGAVDVLRSLHAVYGVVAVVSGRPIAYLAAHLPSDLTLCGLYGLESMVDGHVVQHPAAAGWPAVIDEAAARTASDGPGGVDIEHKGLSLTLHVRRHPELAEAVAVWADHLAARTGLVARPAKMSVELHPPVDVDKGTVVEALAASMAAACYVGDDVGDLPAFAALDRLAATGVATLKVAVHTPDRDRALLDQAHLRVDGPPGTLAFLRALL